MCTTHIPSLAYAPSHTQSGCIHNLSVSLAKRRTLVLLSYCQYWCQTAPILSILKIIPYLASCGFRAARLPGQATCVVEPLCHSQVSMQSETVSVVVSNKHNRPEFYLGQCPGLEPPMYLTVMRPAQPVCKYIPCIYRGNLHMGS